MIRSMGMECSHGKAEICSKGIIRRMREKGMARCIGQMGLSTKVSGRKDVSMERGSCCSQMGVYLRGTFR